MYFETLEQVCHNPKGLFMDKKNVVEREKNPVVMLTVSHFQSPAKLQPKKNQKWGENSKSNYVNLRIKRGSPLQP